jgi:hypothetical protein
MGDGHWAQKGILRFLLKILWSVGGHHDHVDGLPRVRADDLHPVLPLLEHGDIVLMGNNGVLSHVAVHVGDGQLVHSMATEKTMRGWWGSMIDALKRPFRPAEVLTGVVEEAWVAFFERYERDTWIVVRHPAVDGDGRHRGVAHIRSLVGKAYDYDFTDDDDEYYCTEIVIEFLRTALPESPEFERRRVKVPMLMDSQVIEPVALLRHEQIVAVAANEAARSNYADHLEDARFW